ncbi:MAG: pilus assembly protein [Hahellaceae bacterium]|nr:pilus assembly protein [Hahellaceae bacterium]
MKTLLPRRIAGQGMTEYLIIVALIAVAAIGVYGLFGSAVRNQVASMAAEIGGEEGEQAVRRANASGNRALAVSSESNRANLKDYNKAATKALSQ